ncbi:unnamed protein product [Ilex paraguariensis]|uniref:Uncharacterized protein n=1 Tax=Ilex paraguariensis TaxID=185542 RepID=A0ABC8RE65_9AQUA
MTKYLNCHEGPCRILARNGKRKQWLRIELRAYLAVCHWANEDKTLSLLLNLQLSGHHVSLVFFNEIHGCSSGMPQNEL